MELLEIARYMLANGNYYDAKWAFDYAASPRAIYLNKVFYAPAQEILDRVGEFWFRNLQCEVSTTIGLQVYELAD
jgi:hypothetical protein